MITEMYYDAFAEEYTLHVDPCAPPERYIKTLRMDNEFYVEHWMDDAGKELDIRYPEKDYYSALHVGIYKEACKQKNFNPKIMVWFALPASKFDEYVERFGLKEGGAS